MGQGGQAYRVRFDLPRPQGSGTSHGTRGVPGRRRCHLRVLRHPGQNQGGRRNKLGGKPRGQSWGKGMGGWSDGVLGWETSAERASLGNLALEKTSLTYETGVVHSPLPLV